MNECMYVCMYVQVWSGQIRNCLRGFLGLDERDVCMYVCAYVCVYVCVVWVSYQLPLPGFLGLD